MEMWWEGLQEAINGFNLLYLFGGTVFGLVVGALPGLGPMFAVTLALPLTFGMPASTAIIMLSAIHAATCFGGSIASILINTPGSVGSVATCWDGFPMSQQGKSGYALGLSAGGSLLGGIIGWLFLVITAPLLIELALRMGSAEYFMVAILALSLLSMASQGQTIKGVILGAFGLLLSYIGCDPIWGGSRFTFGIMFLEDGLPLAVVFIGFFALSQAIVLFTKGGSIMEVKEMKESVFSGVIGVIRRPFTVIRGGIIGVLLGIMPALGISSASIVAYLVEKRASKHPENFGRGEPAGVLAPEVANNACLVSDLIPTLTLGIPGNAVTAALLGGLLIHGLIPGPHLFRDAPDVLYPFIFSLFLANAFFAVAAFGGLRWVAKVVLVPQGIIAPMVTALAVIGAFSFRNMVFDIGITLGLGFIGYILRKARYPLAPIILGIILGPLAEENLDRVITLAAAHDMSVFGFFLSRALTVVLMVMTVAAIAYSFYRDFRRRQLLKASGISLDEED